MEVAAPSPTPAPPASSSSVPLGFEFAVKTSPFLSAPSSPKRCFGPAELYLSAPASPARASQLYADFDAAFSFQTGAPLNWGEEGSPGTPKLSATAPDDFAFAVHLDPHSSASDRPSLSAEELFHGGKIRPLEPPPRLLPGGGEIWNRRRGVSPTSYPEESNAAGDSHADRERGRERGVRDSSSRSRRETRSLSPCRPSDHHPRTLESSADTAAAAASKGSSSRKWRLRDFLLFRSASEGRATDKDGLKYRSLFKKSNNGNGSGGDDDKDRSFRSGEGSRRRGQVSAHELHYTANRAVSEDRRKKTFLPYKQGIFSFGSAFAARR